MEKMFASPWNYVALILAVATIISLSVFLATQCYGLVWLVRLQLGEQHELRDWRGVAEGAVGNDGVRERRGEEREEEGGEEGREEVREEVAGARPLPSTE